MHQARGEKAGFDVAYDFDVRDNNGKSLPSEKTQRTADAKALGNRTLKPAGKLRKESDLLSEAYDMSQPGEYLIQCSRSNLARSERRCSSSRSKQDYGKGLPARLVTLTFLLCFSRAFHVSVAKSPFCFSI